MQTADLLGSMDRVVIKFCSTFSSRRPTASVLPVTKLQLTADTLLLLHCSTERPFDLHGHLFLTFMTYVVTSHVRQLGLVKLNRERTIVMCHKMDALGLHCWRQVLFVAGLSPIVSFVVGP